MCEIVMKYNRKSFFGGMPEYTEDRAPATLERIERAFSFFKKNRDSAIDVEAVNFSFDSISDFENGVVLVIKSYISSREYVKMSFRSAKKYAREILMEEGVF